MKLPYGFERHPKTGRLVINRSEQKVLKAIAELRALGFSLEQIKSKLDERKLSRNEK